MALGHENNSGRPLNQRGQGAAEAILTLPAFLILVSLVFQLFFLCIAQAQLHYAAFYAARVGSVNAGDKTAMRKAVKKILFRSPGAISTLDSSFEVEIVGSSEFDENTENKKQLPADNNLKVQIRWDYPLIVPFVDSLIPGKHRLPLSGKPSVRLQASWVMTRYGSHSKDNGDAVH